MRFVRTLKLRPLLFSAFSIVAVLLVVSGTIGYTQLRQVEKRAAQTYESHTMPLQDFMLLTESFQRMRVNLRDMVFAGDLQQERYFGERVDVLMLRIDSLKNVLEGYIDTPELEVAFAEFEASGATYTEFRDRVKAHAFAEDEDEEAVALLQGGALEAALAEQAAIRELVRLKVEDAQNYAEESGRIAMIANIVSFSAIGLGLLLALWLGWFIAGIISDPVSKLTRAAGQVIEGDLDAVVEIKEENELGELGHRFNEMVDQIRVSQEQIHREKDAVEATMRDVEAEQAYLSRSVSTMIQSMERFAAGDLSVRLTAERPDDIQRLYE
ncbi:MAG: HAMP domain-containing protein, partial [Bacteroidota bacterium]